MNKPQTKKLKLQSLTRPLIRFFEVEAASGIVLLACTIIALLLANSPYADAYFRLWQTKLSLQFGESTWGLSIGHWINDGLMTVFFFVVGLEIKRELVHGELNNPRVAALPAIAALGGMVVPAMIYLLTLGEQSGSARQGWGIPMATDIAFVVGFLSLFGARVPHGLKIFLLSLAIVDDLGAVLVIAIFYSSNISLAALLLGASGLALTVLLNRSGVRQIPIYVVVGIGIWSAFLASGVHPTVAGVLLGLLTPTSAWLEGRSLIELLSDLRDSHASAKLPINYEKINGLIHVAKEIISPLERLEIRLHPWVAFLIMPIFALANAGVPLEVAAITAPVAKSVAFGLVLGKPLGIVLFSWLAVKIVRTRLPSGTTWPMLGSAGVLAGIGFTMSIFIASLALDQNQLVAGKAGTLLGSSIAVMIGLIALHLTLPRRNKTPQA